MSNTTPARPPNQDAGIDLAAVCELLREWLPTQRWFGGKGSAINAVRVVSSTPLAAPQKGADGEPEQPQVQHLLVAVDQEGGANTYQVPISLRQEADERLAHVHIGNVRDRHLYDAAHDKAAVGVLVAGFRRSGTHETGSDSGSAPGSASDSPTSGGSTGGLRFETLPTAADVPLDGSPLVMTAEQSNTSVVLGDSAILKLFRRVAPGRNPDIEIHDALTRAGSSHVASLLGWLEGTWDDDSGQTGTGSLAMLQQFLSTATDGWELAKASVRDLYAEGDLHADEVGGDFAGEAARLGAATAEVHALMREQLATGALTNDDLRARAAAMRGRLEGALEVVPALREHAQGLYRAFDELGALAGPVPVQRIHGDYHLGQVLRTVTGWVLLDFEGEPAKSLQERLELDTPLRDVAGMLRSFDYAARHLLTDQDYDQQLLYRADEWAARNREAFCRGYGETAGRDPQQDAVILRAYEVDKAVYEAVYEARNRPTWLPIPLSAIARLTA